MRAGIGVSAPPGGRGRPSRSGAYLAADGLHPVEPVQGLLGVPQVLLELRVQDPHGKGDHGAWKQSQRGVSLSAAAERSREPAPSTAGNPRVFPKQGGQPLHFLAKRTVMPVLEWVPAPSVKRVSQTTTTGGLAVTSCPQLRPKRVEALTVRKIAEATTLLQNRTLVDPL